MPKKECVAMLLAGGEGRRLGALTQAVAKPAISYGGKYRIIDFTLSNCTNSGIDTVGVLTQYEPLLLNRYIGIGSPWDLDRKGGGVSVLPPYLKTEGGDWYKGTADAIWQHIGFIEQYEPEYVLVISGDHIYKMNYDLLLQAHKTSGAEATIAVIEVPWAETSRLGIIEADAANRITSFIEKPKQATSNLASMGVYMFTWAELKRQLLKDASDSSSSHDFGKNIIPRMLQDHIQLHAYRFQGYWKDVGTIHSLWEANMDLLQTPPLFYLNDEHWRIYSQNPNEPGQYISSDAIIKNSLVNEGCSVYGTVTQSVLFYGVHVGAESSVSESVVMPGARIGSGATVVRAIVGEDAIIEDGAIVGSDKGPITLIPGGAVASRAQLGEIV